MAYKGYTGYDPAKVKDVLKYKKTHYKTITLSFNKDYYAEELKPFCESICVPISTFIKEAIENEMKRRKAND